MKEAPWIARIEGWRFLLPAASVLAVVEDAAPTPLHHAPAWLVGMVHAEGRAWGVVDLGRFLGVCTARPGVIVLPAQPERAAWALRVHAVEAGPSHTRRIPFDAEAPSDATAVVVASRTRPTFAVARHEWSDEGGATLHADELSLSIWARHPRLTEARP